MQLTPSERDRLLIFTAATLARARRDRGLLLNAPEATAIIADSVIEAARGGASHSEALAAGQTAVSASELMPGVSAMLNNIAVEAVFDDGRRLVVVPQIADAPPSTPADPGSVTRLGPGPQIPKGQTTISVLNTSDMRISVTSHMHFFEVNPRLQFDRAAAYGMHLAIPAGDHLDFPPQEPVEVPLAPISGDRVIIGFAGLVDGPLDAPGARDRALERARHFGYLGA